MKARTLATVIGGIVTHAVAILCWYGAWRIYQVDMLKFWVNLILPFGALILGFVGAAGFLLFGRLVKQPATGELRWIAVAIAVAAAFAMRFLGYWNIEFDGVPLHDQIGFLPYLQATLGHTRMDFSHASHALGSIEIGPIGYLMEAIQTGVYAATSYAVVGLLPLAVRCDRCRGAMDEILSGKVRMEEHRAFEDYYANLPAHPVARLPALEATESQAHGGTTGAIVLHYRLAECPSCSAAALAESGKIFTGQYWTTLKPLNLISRFDRTRAAPPPPAPPVIAPARTFGRRIIT
jgi:hypothetical protein